jgi:hypothetical protein
MLQQFNPFYNSLIGKVHSYNNLNNVRNGPVTVLVQSKEDPNKLVAIFVQHGLEDLGKYSTFEHTVTAVPEMLNQTNVRC